MKYIHIKPILIISCIILTYFSVTANSQAPISIRKKADTVEYEVLLPADFYKSDNKTKYSLIFVMHGANGKIEWMTDYWYSSHATDQRYIIVCPQLEYTNIPYSEIFTKINCVLDVVKNEYSIDTNNLYLTGFSAGGETAIYYAIKNPYEFRAIAVVGGELRRAVLDNYYDKNNIRKLRFYILSGKDDNIMSHFENMVNILKDYGADVKAELIEGGHEYEIDQVLKTLNYFNEIREKK